MYRAWHKKAAQKKRGKKYDFLSHSFGSKHFEFVCLSPYHYFPGDSVVKNCLQYRRHRFDPRVKKISWRKKWQPTPVFLPEKSHGQRSQAGCNPWGRRVRHNLAIKQCFLLRFASAVFFSQTDPILHFSVYHKSIFHQSFQEDIPKTTSPLKSVQGPSLHCLLFVCNIEDVTSY